MRKVSPSAVIRRLPLKAEYREIALAMLALAEAAGRALLEPPKKAGK